MREIKFRVWWEDRKMFYGDLDLNNLIPKNKNEIYELMQFTGLKDKKGEEIYEGDIMYVAGTGNVEIRFIYGCFGYTDNCNFYALFDDAEGDVEEVIGNIYENPELLEIKKGSEE